MSLPALMRRTLDVADIGKHVRSPFILLLRNNLSIQPQVERKSLAEPPV